GKKTRGLALAGLFTAVVVIIQYATAPAGQLITGSLVNLALIMGVCMAGLLPGLAVGAVSPFFASLVGIGPPFLVILPFMALGNMTIIAIWHYISNTKTLRSPHWRRIISTVCGAVLKAAVLYLSIVRVALPYLTNASEAQAAKFSAMFSLPQLFTALIGGVVACAVLPLLDKAVQKRKAIN
ncbi:MAG: ECF transporter S component, partial [Clostridia bacterium]|nr:ECF transporter S component [Clostridia bacterium]